MANQEEILNAAFGHFANWPAEKTQFEALLHADVHWVETDEELGRGNYRGKPAVMAHLDHIKEHVTSASLISVRQRPPGWQTRDEMQVDGHGVHCCITDIDFTGDLISRVIHCKGHFEVGEGPCG
jgi:hypothetical protein